MHNPPSTLLRWCDGIVQAPICIDLGRHRPHEAAVIVLDAGHWQARTGRLIDELGARLFPVWQTVLDAVPALAELPAWRHHFVIVNKDRSHLVLLDRPAPPFCTPAIVALMPGTGLHEHALAISDLCSLYDVHRLAAGIDIARDIARDIAANAASSGEDRHASHT